jgi:hypothetical protein
MSKMIVAVFGLVINGFSASMYSEAFGNLFTSLGHKIEYRNDAIPMKHSPKYVQCNLGIVDELLASAAAASLMPSHLPTTLGESKKNQQSVD